MPLTVAPGYGTTLSYGATDYSGLTAVGSIVDIEVPEMEVDAVQTSSFGSSGHTHTYQAGWNKPGKLKITINWSASVVSTLEGFRAAGTMKGWVITLNDGTTIGGTTASTIKFNGFIIKTGAKIPMDKLDTWTFEVQQSGDTTFTAGS